MTGPVSERVDRPCKGPQRLTRRADFLKAAKGARISARAFALQGVAQAEVSEPGARVGLTVTRKVGHAVERNRIRRRLKEVLRLTQDLPLHQSHDYVIIARREALSTPFSQLQQELARSLTKLHDPDRRTGPRPQRAKS
jgi:ribonuclease P protein component